MRAAIFKHADRQELAREFGATGIVEACGEEASQAVLELTGGIGAINPGRVFDYETDLDHIADAYKAMDERRVIKSLVRIGTV